MARILWGSEQPTRPTGYGVVTREVVRRLAQTHGHEVFVIGWDYNGEPFPHPEGWTMVHAGIQGYGAERLNPSHPESPTVLDMHLSDLKPDAYVSLIDPWFIGHAVLSCNRARVPYLAYLPVDGYPLSYQWSRILANLHTPVWMAQFGHQQFTEFVGEFGPNGSAPEDARLAELGRFASDAGPVIYHGVDVDVFKPLSLAEKEAARAALGLPWATVLLSVARNTNRKQIPRLLDALKRAVDDGHDVGLVLHCGDPTDTMGMGGWNLPDMVKQKGLTDRVRFSDASSNPLYGVPREDLARLYGLADAHVMATGGEGFGIPSLEAMACGLPIILPDNSTGPELVGDAERGWLVPCSDFITGPKWGVNMGIVDVPALASAISEVCTKPADVRARGKAARAFAEGFSWDAIAEQFHTLITSSIEKQTPWGMD